MANMKRVGFGQVEPNHLNFQRGGGVYAQLPAKDDIDVLENGQFAKYNYKEGVVDFDGEGEWLMVFNEVKLYDGWRETYKDFALQKVNAVDGEMYPRLVKTYVGDIYTTNCLKEAGKKGVELEMDEYTVGTKLTIGAKGYLEVNASPAADDIVWQVVKVYNLADGQEAVKLQRIA